MLAGRVARRIGLDRNPLRRRSDRIEAWVTLILMAMVLVVGPLTAWHAAGSAYYHAVRASEWDRQHRFQVTAVLVTDADVGVQAPDDDHPMEPTGQARWVAPEGSARTGVVTAEPDQRAGSTVVIWTDRHGAVTLPPVERNSSMDGLAAGLLAAIGVVVGVVGILTLVRRRLDNRRMDQWQTEWMFVEPGWSGRR